MLPLIDLPNANLRPTPTTLRWRGARVWCIRYSSTTAVANGTVVYTFPEPAVQSPETTVSFRIVNVIGWMSLGVGFSYALAQTQSNINTTAVSSSGFHINAAGQLRWTRGGTSNAQSIHAYIFYVRSRA